MFVKKKTFGHGFSMTISKVTITPISSPPFIFFCQQSDKKHRKIHFCTVLLEFLYRKKKGSSMTALEKLESLLQGLNKHKGFKQLALFSLKSVRSFYTDLDGKNLGNSNLSLREVADAIFS